MAFLLFSYKRLCTVAFGIRKIICVCQSAPQIVRVYSQKRNNHFDKKAYSLIAKMQSIGKVSNDFCSLHLMLYISCVNLKFSTMFSCFTNFS